MARFEVLQAYTKESGAAYMPEKKKGVEMEEWKDKMIDWCVNQRIKYRTGRLMSWQYDKLVSIGFSFDPLGDRVEENFRELLEFREKYGHTRVPAYDKEYPILSTWVQTLRSKPPTGELKERLDAVGFVWRARKDIWDDKYRELLQFRDKHGHMKVPKVFEGSTSLSSWVKSMRQLREQNNKKILTDERIRLLDSIGFEWSPMTDNWDENFKKMKRYMKRDGGKLIWSSYRHDRSFVLWLNLNRRNKEKMPKNRINKLNKAGFDWAPMKDKWAKRFEELSRYKEKNGNCIVPARSEGKQALYIWTARMRRDKAKLSQYKIDMLDSIGFDWVKEDGVAGKGRCTPAISKPDAAKPVDMGGELNDTVPEKDENENYNPLQDLIDYFNY